MVDLAQRLDGGLSGAVPLLARPAQLDAEIGLLQPLPQVRAGQPGRWDAPAQRGLWQRGRDLLPADRQALEQQLPVVAAAARVKGALPVHLWHGAGHELHEDADLLLEVPHSLHLRWRSVDPRVAHGLQGRRAKAEVEVVQSGGDEKGPARTAHDLKRLGKALGDLLQRAASLEGLENTHLLGGGGLDWQWKDVHR